MPAPAPSRRRPFLPERATAVFDYCAVTVTRAAPQQEGVEPVVDGSDALEVISVVVTAVTAQIAISRAAPSWWGASAASHRANCEKVESVGHGDGMRRPLSN
jgi:hypothetical protein